MQLVKALPCPTGLVKLGVALGAEGRALHQRYAHRHLTASHGTALRVAHSGLIGEALRSLGMRRVESGKLKVESYRGGD